MDGRTSLIRTHLGQKKVSSLVRCPDFRGRNVFGTAECVLFIEVPLFYAVLNNGIYRTTNLIFVWMVYYNTFV